MSVAVTFRQLHDGPTPLVLPNAWDVASAVALARAGFAAVGTTSLGVAAAAGLPDAAGAARAETVALAGAIVGLPVPVTIDIEAGFSDDPGAVADLVAELAALGVAGVNLEDGRPGKVLAPVAEQVRRIRAVREAAPGLFLNARTDTHWFDAGAPAVAATERVRAYADAGADGVFVPALADPEAVAQVVAAVEVPVNLLFLPGRTTVTGLAELGVRRISTGSLLYRAALHGALAAAAAVRDGTPVANGIPAYAEVEKLRP